MSTPPARPPASAAPPRDAVDDATLVRRAADGHLDAFEVLVQRHQGLVYRVALRMLGDPTDAEDAAQDAFLDAWRGLDRFRGESSVSTWLYRITVNRCLQTVRRRREVTSLSEIGTSGEAGGDLPAEESGRPDRTVERRQRRAAVGAAIRELPGPLRAVLVLYEFERLSYGEISDVLGVPAPTVRGRLARARQHLAQRLEEWR